MISAVHVTLCTYQPSLFLLASFFLHTLVSSAKTAATSYQSLPMAVWNHVQTMHLTINMPKTHTIARTMEDNTKCTTMNNVGQKPIITHTIIQLLHYMHNTQCLLISFLCVMCCFSISFFLLFKYIHNYIKPILPN